MYTITLEINQICNFCCKYCYLGALSKKEMSFKIATNALEIAFLNAKRHPDHRVWVDFVGLETLLSFNFIERLCQWIDEHCLTKLCIMNYEHNEEGEKVPNAVMCYLEKKKQQLWQEFCLN